MLANRTSRWSIGAALICIVVFVASYFLLISPRRADAQGVRVQVGQSDNQATVLQAHIAQLKAEFADLPKQKAQLKAIKDQLPPTADMPAFVRTLQSLAAQAGVSLDSITPGTPVVVTPVGVAAPTVAGAGTLVSIPMSMVITGEYFEVSLFLKNLQTKTQRSFLVTGFAAAPATVATTTPPVAVTVAPTTTASASPSATSTPTATSTGSAVPAATLDHMALTMSGSIFVLLDGTATLDDVTKQVAVAGGKTKAGATVAATVAGGVPVTAPTAAGGAAS